MCAWRDGEQILKTSLWGKPVCGSIHGLAISTTYNCYDDAGGYPTKNTDVFEDSPRLGFTYCSPGQTNKFSGISNIHDVNL